MDHLLWKNTSSPFFSCLPNKKQIDAPCVNVNLVCSVLTLFCVSLFPSKWKPHSLNAQPSLHVYSNWESRLNDCRVKINIPITPHLGNPFHARCFSILFWEQCLKWRCTSNSKWPSESNSYQGEWICSLNRSALLSTYKVCRSLQSLSH